MKFKSILLLSLLLTIISCNQNEKGPDKDQSEPTKSKEYSPYAGNYSPAPLPEEMDRPFFGDTHLHSSWSADAGMAGATLGPDEAYKISRGEEVKSHLGWKVKLVRPLDFLVLADHAENLGLSDFIERSDPILMANETGKKWHDMVKEGNGYEAFMEWLRADNVDMINEPAMAKSVWTKVVENADKYYEPGKFTTFHGFEWTSHPGGNNMHRVVIFRDGKDRTSQVLPYSQYNSVDPEDLWDYMEVYEKSTGGRVLAIPHNGNLSNGLMFETETTYNGDPITVEYTRQRIRFEPLAEVTQQKGDGEAHPLLSPDDAFADFETLDKGNLNGKVAKTNDMLYKEYAREALKTGLALEEKTGINPYKFGMIGSTDNHTALPTSREENNFSKASFVEPDPDRWKHYLVQGASEELSILEKDVGASGLAAVWATENTREAIWDAMARKEVYATSGTRLIVRVFAGWNFDESHLGSNLVKNGYSNGVPMGGDLKVAPDGKAPSFIIRAAKDPDGANLDRIQVIKGWLDDQGEKHEKVIDVAVSGDRKIINGTCSEPVGSTVDISVPTYSNTIGEAEMELTWTDPDFDPAVRAFYYIRVIEIPTPRWTAFDAAFFEVQMTDDVKMTVQDRAYTSPIWYSPK